ncbi:MAG: NADH:ubiquinone reductase (Na(+)-transporting) subunit B [Dysgonamonadaceae bacterium]|jgi:Na+-transporting NADH:ubiquinone oxidoreductase subunit B|nr:NADH:ubiquinone reductase (Na(+)-transporting) subunit B [Dysgonamonadaceae bacterium]
MKFLRNYLDKIKPNFEKGGKLDMFHAVFDGFETFLFVPNKTSKSGVHIHDAVDSKRTMTFVIIALIPALLFGMYNTGYQHYLAIGQNPGFWNTFLFGFLAVFPVVVVSYVVGLGIEFVVAQWKGHEIQEGFLVSGMLIPLIVPVDTPLWMIAVATAFAVIFAKEVFGGTGYNIWNVALVTRAFLFFAYPSKMSGDLVFVRTGNVLGMGSGQVVDAFSGATPLGQITAAASGPVQVTDVLGNPLSLWDMFFGLIPGSIGETSKLAILIGAVFLLVTGVASWKTMGFVFFGGIITSLIFNAIGTTPGMLIKPYEHIMLGGFAFGAVFMATDPVTSARTETGKYIFGFLVGLFAVLIRVLNPGYPEGMMLSILLMNSFAPLIDFYVIEANIRKRLKRVVAQSDNRGKI